MIIRSMGRKSARIEETCTCGFPGSPTDRHLRSITHRRGRLLRKLLADETLTIAEIGAVVGVSRQCAHQWARQLGVLADRKRARRARAVAEVMAASPRLAQLEKFARRRRWSFELMRGAGGSLRKQAAVVNGYSCIIRSLYVYKSKQYRIVRPSRTADFLVAFELGALNGALVLPFPAWPESTTTFVIDPVPYLVRSTWRNYVGAWHLLDQPKRNRR